VEFIFISNKLFLNSEEILKFLDILSKNATEGEVDEDTKLKMIMGMEYFQDCLEKEIDKMKVGIELDQMGFPDDKLKIQKFEIK